jgi:hypothetical protein
MTTVTIGDGESTSFWLDSWAGVPLRQHWPRLFAASRWKNRTVADAFSRDNWLNDLRGRVSPELVFDFILLRDIARAVILTGEDDVFRWNSPSGVYLAKSH